MDDPKFRVDDKVTAINIEGKPEGRIVSGPLEPGVKFWPNGSQFYGYSYLVAFSDCPRLVGEDALELVCAWVFCPGKHRWNQAANCYERPERNCTLSCCDA